MAGPRDDARLRGLPESRGGTGYKRPPRDDTGGVKPIQPTQQGISRYNTKGNAIVQNIDMTEMRSYLNELSLSNYYQVNLNTLTNQKTLVLAFDRDPIAKILAEARVCENVFYSGGGVYGPGNNICFTELAL